MLQILSDPRGKNDLTVKNTWGGQVSKTIHLPCLNNSHFAWRSVLRNDQYSSFNGLYHVAHTSEDHWLTQLMKVHDLQDRIIREINVVERRKERNEIDLSNRNINPSLAPILWFQSLCPWDKTQHWSRKLWLVYVLQLNKLAVYYSCLSDKSKLEILSMKFWSQCSRYHLKFKAVIS